MNALEFIAWVAVGTIAIWLTLFTVLLLAAATKALANLNKTSKATRPKLKIVDND